MRITTVRFEDPTLELTIEPGQAVLRRGGVSCGPPLTATGGLDLLRAYAGALDGGAGSGAASARPALEDKATPAQRQAAGRLREWFADAGARDLVVARGYRFQAGAHIAPPAGGAAPRADDAGATRDAPLRDLLAWLAPPGGPPADVLFALGTRSHHPFEGPGATRYRALAVDATCVADLAARIARARPDARIRALADVEVLAELAQGRGTAVVTLGMGNVNGVTERAVAALIAEGVAPRPAFPRANVLAGPDGEPLSEGLQPRLGCVSALGPGVYPSLAPRRTIRVLVCAGIGALGTLAATRAVARLLGEPLGNAVEDAAFQRLEADGGRGLLVCARPRADAYYALHGGQTLHREPDRGAGDVPFEVRGLDEGSPGGPISLVR